MKFLTVGDVHCKNIWKDLIKDPELYDQIIFLGDYCDSFDHTNEEMIENLQEIISFKDKYPDKVVLLWGNHCHYAWTPPHLDNPYWCSGYRGDAHFDLYDIYKANYYKFQLAYQYKNYLWTHAGIHQGWWNFDYPYSKEDLQDVAKILNGAFEERLPSIFQVGWMRGGFKDVGGPLWADKAMTSKKPLNGLHQIVGHSRVDNIMTITKDENTSITYCDCLDKNIKLYELEIDED